MSVSSPAFSPAARSACGFLRSTQTESGSHALARSCHSSLHYLLQIAQKLLAQLRSAQRILHRRLQIALQNIIGVHYYQNFLLTMRYFCVIITTTIQHLQLYKQDLSTYVVSIKLLIELQLLAVPMVLGFPSAMCTAFLFFWLIVVFCGVRYYN